MKQFKVQEYTINVYTDVIEWGKTFYDMPDDAILLDNGFDEDCMGFSEITNKEIWVFIPKNVANNDIGVTVAHELGHIITPKFMVNPEIVEGNEEIHEEKAEFYENFYITVQKIVSKIFALLNIKH